MKPDWEILKKTFSREDVYALKDAARASTLLHPEDGLLPQITLLLGLNESFRVDELVRLGSKTWIFPENSPKSGCSPPREPRNAWSLSPVISGTCSSNSFDGKKEPRPGSLRNPITCSRTGLENAWTPGAWNPSFRVWCPKRRFEHNHFRGESRRVGIPPRAQRQVTNL